MNFENYRKSENKTYSGFFIVFYNLLLHIYWCFQVNSKLDNYPI